MEKNSSASPLRLLALVADLVVAVPAGIALATVVNVLPLGRGADLAAGVARRLVAGPGGISGPHPEGEQVGAGLGYHW